MADTSVDASVLVVGAGPTGLVLAAELARRGVACELIDERSGPQAWDRATVVHPGSLEVFEAMGIADRFLQAGTPQRGARIYAAGKVLGEYEITDSGSTYPYNLGMSEEVTEGILTDHLRTLGGDVTRSARLVGLTPGADGLVAEIDRAGNRSATAYRWVVGCDGLHSVVRTSSGIALEGHEIAEPWAVFDATLSGWSDRFDLTFVYLEPVPVIFTALPDRRWRVYLRPSSPDADLVTDAMSTLTRYEPDVTFVDVERPTRFHCHTMIAGRFRKGSVLVAGDAAHLCSPSQGHGMNTGLQDAMNLAWKLALVAGGHAAPALLDSYDAERRPIAEMVAGAGDEFEHMQLLTEAVERDRRDQELRADFSSVAGRHHEIVAAAEMDVSYVGSPIVAGDVVPTGRGVSAGARLPALRQLVHRAGHTVLLLAAPTLGPDALTELAAAVGAVSTDSPLFEATVCEVVDAATADCLGIAGVTLLAVRPDGYVGLRADDDHVAALGAYGRRITG